MAKMKSKYVILDGQSMDEITDEGNDLAVEAFSWS